MTKGYTNVLKSERAILMPVCRAVLKAFGEQRDAIPDSDLDDDQPISLNVRLTLGQARNLKRTLRE